MIRPSEESIDPSQPERKADHWNFSGSKNNPGLRRGWCKARVTNPWPWQTIAASSGKSGLRVVASAEIDATKSSMLLPEEAEPILQIFLAEAESAAREGIALGQDS
jgi:hypothetical protein